MSAAAIVALALAACGGGGGSSPPPSNGGGGNPPPAVQYSIGGSVTGLTGTGLVLQDNGGDNLAISGNGPFTFATKINSGSAYNVTVMTQPSNPAQTCTVANGSSTASADVTNVAVSCTNSVQAGTTGKFAYTADNAGGKIYAYAIDQTSGALTPVSGSPYADGTAPAAVSLAPNGKFAFSASDNGTKINAFTIDQTTGALTAVAGSPFSTGFTIGSAFPDIAVDSQSAHLYLASAGDAKVAGFSIDATTGALTALAGSPYAAGTNAGGIPAFSPDGKYLYVVDQNTSGGSVSGYSIDPTTGVLTALAGSPFAAGSNPYWIVFTPNGQFAYVSNFSGNNISAYSVSAGVLTAMPTPVPVDGGPQDLTIDPAGTHLFVPVSSGGANGGVDVFTINADGTLTKVTGSPYAVGIGPRFVDVDPTGKYAYVSSAGTAGTGVYGFSIDPSTGALTALSGSPYSTGANSQPQFITVDASGKFGYTANQGSGTISGFAIDPATGVLSAIAGSPFATATGARPFFVSISPEAPGIRD
ncbi:MAG TPA: beta-propeller fold lactonase family protein [Steroidobacteraceae bacterium]|nr:beta-propeller fold lactonase family protein [Steroidobacteraceae bacterium]